MKDAIFFNDEIFDDGEACEFVGSAGIVWFCVDDIDVADLVLSLFNEIWSIDTFDLDFDLDLDFWVG